MLSLESYETELVPDQRFNGLGLSGALLERILYRNYQELMSSRPSGTEIVREIDWERMGVKRTMKP